MVRLQKSSHQDCPICRSNVVLRADSCIFSLDVLTGSESGLRLHEFLEGLFSRRGSNETERRRTAIIGANYSISAIQLHSSVNVNLFFHYILLD